MSFVRYEPFTEADAYFADDRRPLGYCAECGYAVYEEEACLTEEDTPLLIERKYFHDRCVMTFAREHWAIR